MKTVFSPRRGSGIRIVGVFLLVMALVAGMAACAVEHDSDPAVEYSITISSTAGGSVITPGEGSFSYEEGTEVNLVAEAEEGYNFVDWSGDVETVTDVGAAETTITMNGDYSIVAAFAIAVLEIWTWYDLDSIRDDLSGSYVLMNDLDSATAGYTELAGMTANGGKGWEPIGTALFDESNLEEPYIPLAPFTGAFDGQGCEIRDLFINRPAEDAVGLFGVVDEGGVIENVGVVNAAVTGGSVVGGLVGGSVYGSTVRNAYNTGSVTGDLAVGGLVGGNSYGSMVSRSHSTAAVTGTELVGGLLGGNGYEGSVSNCYSTGSVSGNSVIGGLVGVNAYGATVSNCYSTGSVTGDRIVGGLVGVNDEGNVSNSYARGDVSGIGDVGGLVGWNNDTVAHCFWDVESSDIPASAGGTGKTTAEMRDIATFAGAEWDITPVARGETNEAYTWNIVDGEDYPFLSWEEPAAVQEIRTWRDLDAVRNNLSGTYILMNDLDSTTAGYAELAGATANGGKGWEPIGSLDFDLLTGEFELFDPFAGRLDGQGYEIRDLVINRPERGGVGLFGVIDEAGVIENLGVVNVAVTGGGAVGSIVGASVGTITHSYSTGRVTGYMGVGGVAGGNAFAGTVSYSYSTVAVSGFESVGGLVGGTAYGGSVSNSYAIGQVTGSRGVGGLVGVNDGGIVDKCYSRGVVTGAEATGGLVGVTFVPGTVSNSFWDVESSGMAESDGGTGRTTAQMQSIATFAHTAAEGLDEPWDIVAVPAGETNEAYTWNIIDGEGYPFLGWQSAG